MNHDKACSQYVKYGLPMLLFIGKFHITILTKLWMGLKQAWHCKAKHWATELICMWSTANTYSYKKTAELKLSLHCLVFLWNHKSIMLSHSLLTHGRKSVGFNKSELIDRIQTKGAVQTKNSVQKYDNFVKLVKRSTYSKYSANRSHWKF